MDEDMNLGADLLSLTDEDGVEHSFEILDTLELGEQEYYALTPVYDDPTEQLNDSGELVILKVSEDEQGEFMEPVMDEDEYKRVSELFMARLENKFDFDYDPEDD